MAGRTASPQSARVARFVPRSVRGRATIAAVVVVGMALLIASTALLVSLRRTEIDEIRRSVEARASELAAAVRSGIPPDDLPLDEGEDRMAQVLDERGRLVAGSASAGTTPYAGAGGDDVRLPGADDERWLVVTRDAGGASVVTGEEIDSALETVETALAALAVGVPSVLLVVGATTWWLVGRALRPVESIRSRVASIDGSEVERRVPVPDTKDEIAALATTMNDMLARLGEYSARQRRFVADASHELRSPVASIHEMAEVAARNPERSDLESLAAGVLAETERLEDLVDGLLTLARLDAGSPFATSAVDLDDLALEVADPQADPPITASVEAVQAAGDARLLRIALRNLVENASRHGRTRVEVHTRLDPDGTPVLAVDDDGEGIAESDRARAVERFVRLDDARQRDAGGAGLGLSIADEIARVHGGTLVITDSPAGGARVELRFPAR